MVSIAVVMPFLGALLSPEQLMNQPTVAPLLRFFDITEAGQLLMPLTLIFIFGAMLSGAMRIALSWSSIRLAFAIGADLSYTIYRRTLYQPYSVHISRNSSQVISAIVTKVNTAINGVIIPVITLLSSAFLLLAIATVLFAINIEATLFSMLGFGVIYLGIIRKTKNLKRSNGKEIALKSTQVVKGLQEGLGGIRDILLDGSQETYCAIYRSADLSLRRAQGSNQFIALSPRFAIEAIGMSLIAVVALVLHGHSGAMESQIAVLGALALGAQRMLPVMQQSYGAWSTLVGNLPVLNDALEFLDQPVQSEEAEEHITLLLNREIRFSGVGFRYAEDRPMILKNVNISIEKGSLTGIIGKTGSGKTTFVDLLMGLLVPGEGHIEIDGIRVNEHNRRAWQRQIAHVPQSVFLTDSSIAENIAFGIPKEKIDLGRVRYAAGQAQISADIDAWPLRYDTEVGECGICLSGGQRQRIGIARALYKKAKVIVFDEATSALDCDTESAVMAAIENLSDELTVIVIAHRHSTLKNCTKIIEVVKDGALRTRAY
jgi:ATP-binding cassette subfamily B protein